jgi:hypothetical protein
MLVLASACAFSSKFLIFRSKNLVVGSDPIKAANFTTLCAIRPPQPMTSAMIRNEMQSSSQKKRGAFCVSDAWSTPPG